jgi:exopolyphosphatase / guanosine-5'-triphosphate,3'-diphosphate pyrophosphatase
VTAPAGQRVAAIDCGTNSTRLLVAEPPLAPSGRAPLVTVERLMRITRLGRGVSASGQLSPEGVEATVTVLREYRKVLDGLGVDDPHRIRMTATSAARDSANREEFFDAAEATVGVRPELLSGDEEAALSFIGATAELDPAEGPFLVVDIGGGSTELAVGTTEMTGAKSIDVGCVRLTEQYLHHDPPLPEELVACLSITEAWLDDVVRGVPDVSSARTFIGLAGTVSTVAAVEIGLAVYDRDRIHHFHLTREAGEDVFRTLATESFDERIENPGLEKGRADVIVAGCCILQAVFRFFGFTECLVSEADILDGLVRSITPAGA